MSIKLVTILKEALDVSWNPYEEKFKVGDKAKEIYGDEELCKILDKRRNWNEVEINPVKKSYIPMYIPADPEVEKESWYLIQYLEHNANRKLVWVPESNLESIESISEALDVSWNPYEEGNSEFKIGDTVYEIGSEDPSKVIDLAPDFLSATKTTHFKKPVNWGKEYDYDFWYLVHYPLMDLFQWYPEEFLTKEPSAPELDETLDISWNPYQEVNYANKFYEFVDYDYSEGGPTALVFFRDEEGADLRTIVDLETGKILDASEWSGEGNDDTDLDLKVVEQLNQNEYIKDILRRWVYHINKNRLEQDDLDEDLDVSWNPYEKSDYTVMMGQLGDNDNAIVKHYNTKNEHDALVEFFTDVLGQNTDYAKVAASETKKIQLKNSIAYKPKSDKFFWIVVKGYHKEDYINSLSREYRQKYNT